MINIDMFSTASKVKGQGVGSAYKELITMLNKHFSNDFNIKINKYTKADISHYHTINLPFYFSTFFRKRGRKIGYVHFLPETLENSLKLPKLFKIIFYRYIISFYKRMDHLVVVNPTFIPKLQSYGIDKNRISYIPNFVSKNEFYPINNKKELRKKYGYDQNEFIVIGTGQIQNRKGLPDFINLAKENPNIQFIWAGGFSFGHITDGYQELKSIVDHPPKNLYFPGIVNRKKLVEYYNLANLFLLPSYNELFPMSILESFSCGTPVLVRNLNLYKKILDGYYASFNDFNELKNQLNILRNDTNKLNHLSSLALEASNYYSEDHLAKIWYSFYRSQLKER